MTMLLDDDVAANIKLNLFNSILDTGGISTKDAATQANEAYAILYSDAGGGTGDRAALEAALHEVIDSNDMSAARRIAIKAVGVPS
jgi:hypothetical protein